MIFSLAGMDGSGKTSLAKKLASLTGASYRKQKIGRRFNKVISEVNGSVEFSEMPYSKWGGLLSEAYAYDFVEYALRSLNKKSDILVFDRWKICVKAYALFMKADYSIINNIISIVPDADKEFIIDCSHEEAYRRILRRGEPDIDEELDTLCKFRAIYIGLAAEKNAHLLTNSDEAPLKVDDLKRFLY